MKRFYTTFFFLLSLACVNPCLAALDGDGYYRVRNKATQRYIYVCDNTGYINYAATYAEMGAIQLWKGEAKILDDPASVIYVKREGTSSDGTGLFDLQAQGTGVKEIIGYTAQVYETSAGYYKVYAEGFYLCDNETSESPDGFLGTDRKGDYRLWEVFKVDETDDAAFIGVTPSVEHDGKHYAPYYTGFGYSFVNPGMKAYVVTGVHQHGVVYTEVTGSIPNEVPVFLECPESTASGNRLAVTYLPDNSKYSDNKLSGVFFNNSDRPKSADARTAYDAATMRVLGVTSDGQLGFITADIDYLPANQSYLVVSSDADAELPLFSTEQEYTEYETMLGLEEITEDGGSQQIYSITGQKLNVQVKDLQPGIYIINRRKVVIR